jgi:DNA-binding transcriptional ArsR family regulator
MPAAQEQLDSAFHALANPTRRAVLERLGKGSATVSELAAPFDMALACWRRAA